MPFIYSNLAAVNVNFFTFVFFKAIHEDYKNDIYISTNELHEKFNMF